MSKSNDYLRPSLLDRFIGPKSKTAGRVDRAATSTEFKSGVARDLEFLLNTRTWYPKPLEGHEETNDSIFRFGLFDLSPYSWRSDRDAAIICTHIEETIRLFEPRLVPRTVKVQLLPAREREDFRLSFRIDAVLHAEPLKEQVFFDSTVDPISGRVVVEDAG